MWSIPLDSRALYDKGCRPVFSRHASRVTFVKPPYQLKKAGKSQSFGTVCGAACQEGVLSVPIIITPRCGMPWAQRRNKLSAIRGGYSLLGFRPYAWLFENGYVSTTRMLPSWRTTQTPCAAFKKKYREQIEILLGVEAEYQPEDVSYLLERNSSTPWILLLAVHYDSRWEDVYYGGISPEQ